MDLLRRLRSPKDLSATVEKSKKDQRAKSSNIEEEDGDVNGILLHDADQDEGDVFEDAAAALGQQQQQRQQQQDEKQEVPTGAELEEEEGRASHGSGESFDSALERMAASSEASYDTAVSPKTSSPVGSLEQDPVVIGSPPSVLSESQKSALRRLNEMTTGNSSLDTSLIDNSTTGEEFKSRVSELAESSGLRVEDPNFVSIVDALLPLVLEKSRGIQSDEKASKLEGEDDDADEPSKGPQSPMPKAKLTADDDSDGDELQSSEEEEVVDDGALEHAGNDDADVKAETGEDKEVSGVENQPQVVEKDPIGSSDSAEKAPKGSSNSVPDCNGGHDHGSAEAATLPMAKLSAEDEDGIEGRADDELSGDGQPEEDVEEPVEETAGEATQDENFPLQIRALPSDLDDSVSLPYPDYERAKPETEESLNNDENSLPARVPPEEAEEIQTRPFAKVSDDDAHSRTHHPAEQSASSEVRQVVPKELPADESLHTGTPEVSSKGVAKDDTEGLGQVPEKSAGVEPVKGEESAKIPSEEKGEAEVETFDDAEEGDGGDIEEEEEEEEEEEDDEVENEEDEDGSIESSEALAALLRGADFRAGGEADSAPSLGSAGPSLPARPTRTVRSSLPSLEPASRAAQQPRSSQTIRSSSSAAETQADSEPDGNEETREKLQSIRVKFLRLALRLGQSAHNVVVAQVLYRLGLAEQLRGGRSNRPNTAFSFDRASTIAEEQERAGPEELDFDCTIMMLGKTGVGKSATINSIFDEAKTGTNAFSPATNKVQIITGHVHGIKVRVIDTPGLLPSVVDQRHNEKIMASVQGFIKKQSPDIVLYFDRLDMQSRDYGDLPLLRTITDTFGAAVWFNAIVVLTHASSAPPDGPNGLPLSYEMFVAQRSHVVQQTIRQAAGDMRLMNPVSLVENHIACRVNRSGDRVLPNGQVWKPQLLLLCFASKILAEANSLLKLQDNTPGRPFGKRSRVPPLPFLLSSLLQSRAPLKLPNEQVGDEDESDDELEEDDDGSEDEEDYDQLPPFRRLAKEEVAELDEVNRGQYFEELAERERLFQKKQWKEELKRRREVKKRMAEAPTDQSQFGDEGLEEDMDRSAAVPVPMPDMVLPPSFDSDNPSHRYRYLETANQWLVRPVLETHGWDHDSGYDGMSVEKMFVIGDQIPTSISGQITKDKKEANLNMEAAASLKHGEGKVTLAGLDVQTVGKDLAYTLRSETRFSNFKGNNTTGGLALTLLGDTVSAGMKIEDRLLAGKRVKLVLNGGAITGGGDVAYGGSLEATLRDKEYPLSRTLSTLGLSIMDWHGDLAVGGNLQSQFILGKTMMVGRANLNNRGAGQISIRASSSEQLQMALIGILPIVRAIANRVFGQSQQ